MIKIYEFNNVIIIEDLQTNKKFYGIKGIFTINKNSNGRPLYKVYNVEGLENEFILEIGKLVKSNGTLYTESEFDEFYTNKIGITQPLTNSEIRATPLPIYNTVLETTLQSLNTKIPSVGQTTMASSSPVVIASNQSAIPVSGTVTANIGTGSIASGTNLIGDVGVQYRASATGSASRSQIISTASTNATVIKGSAGKLVGWSISNTNAVWRYVKFHNQVTSPTAGSGVVVTIGVPPNSTVSYNLEGGIGFSTGIGLTTVTGAALSDTTAVGLNDLIINIFFV
jgi:hypothetical protein